MKLVIASDLHGSALWARRLMKVVENVRPDRVVLLGDLLYHGPRNDLPEGYAPKEVAAMLNSIAGSIVAVRGNCDAEVDQMVLDFSCMADYALLADGSRTLFLTHGHVPAMTPDDVCATAHLAHIDVYMSGHTHAKRLDRIARTQEKNGQGTVVMLNPGSVSLPKDGTHSYAAYENGLFALKTFDGETLAELAL